MTRSGGVRLGRICCGIACWVLGCALLVPAHASSESDEGPGLFLVGDFEYGYRADLPSELLRSEIPAWRTVHRETLAAEHDDGFWFRVFEDRVSLSNEAPGADEEAIEALRIQSHSFPIEGNMEVVARADVVDLTGECFFGLFLDLVATNTERYHLHVFLAPNWTWAGWSGTFGMPGLWDWTYLGGIEYPTEGEVDLRIEYAAETRLVRFSVDLVPVAEVSLPLQSTQPIQRASVVLEAGDEQEGTLQVDFLGVLVGYD